jgi:hypothetical protein
MPLVSIYKGIHDQNRKVKFKIQVNKYMRMHRTSNMHSDTRNVYSTIHATIYNTLHEMPRIQDHVLPDCISYKKYDD